VQGVGPRRSTQSTPAPQTTLLRRIRKDTLLYTASLVDNLSGQGPSTAGDIVLEEPRKGKRRSGGRGALWGTWRAPL